MPSPLTYTWRSVLRSEGDELQCSVYHTRVSLVLVVLGDAVNVHVSKRYFMLHTDIFNGGSMACESVRVCTQVNKGHCMDPSRLVTLQSCAATCTHLLTSPILRAAQTLKTSTTQQNKTTQNFRHIRQQKHRAYIKWCVSLSLSGVCVCCVSVCEILPRFTHAHIQKENTTQKVRLQRAAFSD